MCGRGPSACLAILASVVALITLPAFATAGVTYSGLELSYTATTTNFTQYPGRASQSTYSPCAGPQKLVGIGAWVGESTLADPWMSSFDVGQVYNVSIRPRNQIDGAPSPDSTKQVAETLFPAPNSVGLGEATVCGEAAGNLSYPSDIKDTPGKHQTTAKVACGPGERVMSGGGSVTGPFRAQRIVESFPFDSDDPGTSPDDGWKVAADNAKNRQRRMRVFAICTDATGFSYEKGTMAAAANARTHNRVDCPGGEYAVGGGIAHAIGFKGARLVASRYTPHPTFDGWITEIDNVSGAEEASRTFAICHA